LDTLNVDLGCGFRPDLHSSLKDSIGLDLNFAHGKISVDYPIIADVQNIPLRPQVAEFIRASAILEHLPDPPACVNEIKRIARDKCGIFILIPVDSKQIRQNLNRFFKEFPFCLLSIFRVLWHSITVRRLEGMPHIKQIDLEFLARHFKLTRVIKKRKTHFWFKWGPFRLLLKWGVIKRSLFIEEFAEYLIDGQVSKC